MEKVRIAIIGLGRVSNSHIDAINHWPELCDLKAVVDAQKDLAETAGNKHNVSYFTSVEELIDSNLVDAAIVCLPHHMHRDIANLLMDSGIHILVEKVMATSVEEGISMVSTAEKNNVNLMVGQSRRFFEGSIEAKKRLKELGQISNLLYTLACYFDENSAPKWWKNKGHTGGLVYTMQGSHSIDFTLWIMEGKKPISVYATGISTNNLFEGHDEASITIKFDDGSLATNILSINTNPIIHDCLIVGEKGSMVFKQGVGNTDLVGVEGTQLLFNGEMIQDGISEPHNFANQMKEFAASIIENRKPIASGEEVLTQLKIISAAQLSSEKGQVVKV